MKFESVPEMFKYADDLVNKYVEAYKEDWTKIDSKAFSGYAEEANKNQLESALFIVRRCGTYLLPLRFKPDGSKAVLSVSAKAYAKYYAKETLGGSKDNRFYLVNYKTLEITKKAAEQVIKMTQDF